MWVNVPVFGGCVLFVFCVSGHCTFSHVSHVEHKYVSKWWLMTFSLWYVYMCVGLPDIIFIYHYFYHTPLHTICLVSSKRKREMTGLSPLSFSSLSSNLITFSSSAASLFPLRLWLFLGVERNVILCSILSVSPPSYFADFLWSIQFPLSLLSPCFISFV